MSTDYAKVGLPSDYGVARLLTLVVGQGRVLELLLLCERAGGERALQIGLFNKVVPADTLRDATLGLVRPLANGPRVAYGYIKDNLDDALTMDRATTTEREAERMLREQSTADHKEAARSFVEKRAPVFQGR